MKNEIVTFISTSLAVMVELGRDCQLLPCRCVAAGALRLQVAAPRAGDSHNYCNFHNMQPLHLSRGVEAAARWTAPPLWREE